MINVNYRILGELFGLLERIEIIYGVDFCGFDPDDPVDVRRIAEDYVKPTVIESSRDAQEYIRHTIAYYAADGEAPIQLMKDRCQELSLPDARSWKQFFHMIAIDVFGRGYADGIRDMDISEQHENSVASDIFRRLE